MKPTRRQLEYFEQVLELDPSPRMARLLEQAKLDLSTQVSPGSVIKAFWRGFARGLLLGLGFRPK